MANYDEGLDPEVFPGEYEEHRDRKQLENDAGHVRRQLRELSQSAESHQRLDQIIDLIQRRQDESTAENAVRFDRYVPEGTPGDDRTVLVARGQLVVRTTRSDEPRGSAAAAQESPREITSILNNMNYRLAPPRLGEPLLDARTQVFYPKEGYTKSPSELKQDIDTLRNQHNIEAAMNVVVPLGHIIKGDDYPARTTGPELRQSASQTAAGDPAVKVRVAVVDTGITPEDRTDDWLDSIRRTAANVEQLDVLPDNGVRRGDGRLDYFSGHGTFTSGVVQRVLPTCEIVPYRFTTNDGLGTEKDVAETMIRAAKDAAEERQRTGVNIRLIINASVGAPEVNGQPPLALRDAMQRIRDLYPEALIVASAGNMGTEDKMYPAGFAKGPANPDGFENVVAVGALMNDLQRAEFSNYGEWVTCWSIGVGVVSTFVKGIEPPEPREDEDDQEFPDNAWGLWSGTSFSAPQISAAVAKRCLQHENETPRDALEGILRDRPVLRENGREFGPICRLLPGTPVTVQP